MNGYLCYSDKMGILLFESLDGDSWDRSMQPIYVEREGTDMANKLNSFMDHQWDGFYTSQKRQSRFPAVIQGNKGSVYTLNFTGSPAKNMRFAVKSMEKLTGFTVTIFYPSAESRQVFANGEYIEYNQWDLDINQYGNVTQQFCGENRYVGVRNYLEFYITGECEIVVRPRNAIQTMVRMEFTMEEFYSEIGGPTRFVDRLCGVLGIHASEVKIVSVYEGSLIINYELMVPDDSQEELEALEKL